MTPSPRRHEPLLKLASGGAASVFVGAARGEARLVALKRPHPHLLDDPRQRASFLAEARLASRIHHAHVVEVREVEEDEGGLQLVMDYVEGASLGQLILHGARSGGRLPPGVAVRVVLDACAGLHAAHELRDEVGAPLDLVHRDVSPQNLLVGLDGATRVTDFGVAKEVRAARAATTEGVLKGKIGYLAPEYVRGRPIDRRADVFAMGVVLWEALAHKRLFRGAHEAEALELVLHEPAPPVSLYAPEAGTALDAVLARALEKCPDDRFSSAEALADALRAAAEPAGLVASREEVARAVEAAVGEELRVRRAEIAGKLAALAPPPPPQRSRRALAAVLAGGAAILGAAAFLARPAVRPDPPPVAASAPVVELPASAPPSADPPPPASAPSAEPPPRPSAARRAPAPTPTASAKRGKALPANPYR